MSRNARSRMGRAIKAAPSFSLDFTRGVLDPRLTFTRASGATYIDSTGVMQTAASNAPRFDYDPITLAIRGLLIEEARTNLSTNSRQFVTGASVGMVQNLPGADGVAFTAYTMTESATTAQQFAVTTPNPSFTSGTTYALTALVKPGSANKCQLTGSGTCFGTTQCVNFSLSGAGSVLQALGGAVGTIKPGPNGFYVCSITVAAITTGTGTAVAVAFITSDTDARLPSITGTSRTLILDHHQAEVGAFPTSIIPTSGAAATRAADVCNAALATWFNSREGVLAAEFRRDVISSTALSANARIVALRQDASNATELMCGTGTPAQQRLSVTLAGSTAVSINQLGTPGALYRLAGSYSRDNFNAAQNGVLGTPDTAGGLPAPVVLDVGNFSGAAQLNGHIRAVDYYPVALEPQTLRRLTSATESPARRINPDFSLHFLDGVLDSRITFARASSATRINAAGVLVTETTNVPRFDYDPITLACRGLLCEETRTNLITRNDMAGAAAGTPGTLPTGWTRVAAGTINVVGTGTENGALYVDIQFVTPSAMSLERMTFQSAGVAVTVASTYCSSFCARLIAGSFTNVSLAPSARITWRDSGGTLLSTTTGAGTISPTAPNLLASRVNTGAAVAPASAAFGVPELVYSSSGASDFTLRIALQQFELGAFPSSFIPTTGAAVTRAADLAQVTDVSWFNKSQGTFVAEHTVSNTTESGVVWELRQGTSGSTPNRFNAFANSSSGRARLQVFPAGVLLLDAILGTPVANAITRSALSYSRALHLGSVAGSAASQTTNALPDFTPGVLNLASTNNTQYGPSVELNGWLRHFDYYKQALPADFITELSR